MTSVRLLNTVRESSKKIGGSGTVGLLIHKIWGYQSESTNVFTFFNKLKCSKETKWYYAASLGTGSFDK